MAGPTGLLIGGVRLDLAVRVDAASINLRKVDDVAHGEARAAVKRAGDKFLGIVHATVAYDTGRMHRLVKVEYSAKGYTFEGGWNAADFEAEGEPFYPPYVELGTSRQMAQPSIEPAYFEVSRRLERDLAAAVSRALERRAAAR